MLIACILDDVKAAREQAASLIQVLQSLTTPDARPESSEGEQKVPVAKHDSISSLQTATSPKKNVPTPSAASTARLAQRSRVAALAAAGRTESAHMRTPSHASGLGNLGKRRIETMARLVAVLKRDMRARYEMPLDDLADR